MKIAETRAVADIACLVAGVVVFISGLSQSVNEKDHITSDSKIMVEELKNRVDAVNMWDK